MKSLFKCTLSATILKKIAEMDEFKGRWESMKSVGRDVLLEMKKVTTIESSGASTRIEGSKLTDIQVATLLQGLTTVRFSSRDEEEVVGYARTMEMIFESHEEILLTENHIKHLHKSLLQFSTKDEYHRGEYKKFPNSVEACDEKGKSLGIIFQTASPFDTVRLMQELVEAASAAFRDRQVHPLLVIAIFIVRFLEIHPFQDGNGRVSRVLTNLLLLRAGYAHVPYRSYERVIEDNKARYYATLREAQKDLDSPDAMAVWVEFFLRGLITQKEALVRNLRAAEATLNMPELATRILETAGMLGRVTLGDLSRRTGANTYTVKKWVQELVYMGKLYPHGEKKGRWYSTSPSEGTLILTEGSAVGLDVLLREHPRLKPHMKLFRSERFVPCEAYVISQPQTHPNITIFGLFVVDCEALRARRHPIKQDFLAWNRIGHTLVYYSGGVGNQHENRKDDSKGKRAPKAQVLPMADFCREYGVNGAYGCDEGGKTSNHHYAGPDDPMLPREEGFRVELRAVFEMAKRRVGVA